MFIRGNGRGRGGASAADNEPAVPVTAVNWRRLLGFLMPYRGRMALVLLALVVSNGMGLAFPLVIVRLLDTVTTATSDTPLNLLALGLLGIFLVQAAFTAL